jgi:hypothetical protein
MQSNRKISNFKQSKKYNENGTNFEHTNTQNFALFMLPAVKKTCYRSEKISNENYMLKLIIMKINFFTFFLFSFLRKPKKKRFLHLKYVFAFNHPSSTFTRPQAITLFTFIFTGNQQKKPKNLFRFNYRIISKK